MSVNKTELDRKHYPQYLELLKVSKQIEEVANRGFDDMYQLGQLSVLSQKRSQASKYVGADGGNY